MARRPAGRHSLIRSPGSHDELAALVLNSHPRRPWRTSSAANGDTEAHSHRAGSWSYTLYRIGTGYPSSQVFSVAFQNLRMP